MQRWDGTIKFAECRPSGGEGNSGLKWQPSRNPKKMGEGGYNPRVIAQGSIEFTACEELVMVGSAWQSASGVAHVIADVRTACVHKRRAMHGLKATPAVFRHAYPEYLSYDSSPFSSRNLQRCGSARPRAFLSVARRHRRKRQGWNRQERKTYLWLRRTRARRTELCRIVHASVDDTSTRPAP